MKTIFSIIALLFVMNGVQAQLAAPTNTSVTYDFKNYNDFPLYKWDAVTGATTYVIKRRVYKGNPNQGTKALNEFPTDKTEFRDVDKQWLLQFYGNGLKVMYQVKAVNATEESAYTEAIEIKL